MADDPQYVIVFCPLCCTSQDVAVPTTQGPIELECAACVQWWSMLIDPVRFAEHAIT